MTARTRLPLALEVFQTLQRYPNFQPRRVPEAPVGCNLYQPKDKGTTPVSSEPADEEAVKYGELTEDEVVKPTPRRRISQSTAQFCLQHLYHDLGVLVFAGCDANQTRRIGDILRLVNQKGGIGGVMADLTPERKAEKNREDTVPNSALNRALNGRWNASMKPEALLQMSSKQLRDMLADKLAVGDLGPSEYELRETNVVLPGFPLPKGVILPSVTGPRKLPVDTFTSMRVHRISGHLKGEVKFHTAGVGDLVGIVQISYAILRLSEPRNKRRIVWARDKDVKGFPSPDPAAQRDARDALTRDVLEPLWQLEREIWKQRAVEMAKLSMTPFEGI